MKNAIIKRIILGSIAALIAVVSVVSLFGCNNDKPKSSTLSDIFKETTSPAEFTSSRREFTLPIGWTVTTEESSDTLSANSDVGYIKSMNAFIVTNGKALTIIKCGDSRVYVNNSKEVGMAGQILPMYYGTTAIRVKDGIVVCKFENGEAGAYDFNGNTLLSRKKIKNVGSTVIDKVIKVLDGGLIAVSSPYDLQGKSGYTSIYRPTTSGKADERGELVCRVNNPSNELSYVSGFEGKYVSVVGNSGGGYMFAVPEHAGDEVKNLSSGNGIISALDKDDYYLEITYIGNGRFLVHEDWTVESTEEFSYYDGDKYYCFRRKIYDAKADTLTAYTDNADKVFLQLANRYYDSSKTGVDAKGYLKDGYMYAPYGINIMGKAGFYDQYILDENLNVVMSLTGNFGIDLETEEKGEVGFLDLIMSETDGYYYVPLLPSKLAVYNGKGELLAENTGLTLTIKSQNIANDVIIACLGDPVDSSIEYYSLFDLQCNEITEQYTTLGGETAHRRYAQIAAFRGYYTIAKHTSDDGGEYCLIDRDGTEIACLTDGKTVPLADMATTKTGVSIFKIGCYMYKTKTTDAEGNDKYFYGIKNFNANPSKNVVMEATMETGCMLYAPPSSATDVFVFEKITASNGDVTYTVHRLI
ncbi:MAG: hypothetical protein IK048_04985 [Clostridia bacterium]|nr:hypothetical protein [Clostridia bacterium]